MFLQFKNFEFFYLTQMRCYLFLNDYYFQKIYLGVYFKYYLNMDVFHENCVYFYCFRDHTKKFFFI